MRSLWISRLLPAVAIAKISCMSNHVRGKKPNIWLNQNLHFRMPFDDMQSQFCATTDSCFCTSVFYLLVCLSRWLDGKSLSVYILHTSFFFSHMFCSSPHPVFSFYLYILKVIQSSIFSLSYLSFLKEIEVENYDPGSKGHKTFSSWSKFTCTPEEERDQWANFVSTFEENVISKDSDQLFVSLWFNVSGRPFEVNEEESAQT